MIALALARTGDYAGLNGMVDAQGNAITAVSQAAYPLLVTSILPVGVRGLVVAGLLAGTYPAWRVCRVQPGLHLKTQ